MQFDLLIILFVTLLLSALFSASEIAFVVANRLKVEVRARKKHFGASTALRYITKPEKFFSTLLIGNNISNVAFSSIAAAMFTALFGWGEMTILFIVSGALLIAGEIVPKTIARDVADFIIITVVVFITGIRVLLYPLVWLSESISSIILKLFKVKNDSISLFFSRRDIDRLVRESQETGDVDVEDGALISKAFSLAEQPVKEVMIPRTEIVAVDQSSSIQEAMKIFRRSGYSRLPVYKDTLDNITGIVYAHDLFKKPRFLRTITREPLFVPDSKKSADLLREFREKGVTISIVVDEFGGTSGLVTTEDLIEELVGEIHDEYDVEEIICENISDSKFLLSGRVEIDYLNETYGLGIPSGDYETIGGYILNSTGMIPIPGETLSVDSFKIIVKNSSLTKILLVELEV